MATTPPSPARAGPQQTCSNCCYAGMRWLYGIQKRNFWIAEETIRPQYFCRYRHITEGEHHCSPEVAPDHSCQHWQATQPSQ